MEIVITTGKDERFVELCHSLDSYLNYIVGGEKQREQYKKYNMLEDIQDVVLVIQEEQAIGCGSFKEYTPNVAEIKRVFVRSDSRCLGVGKLIVEALEKLAYEKRYKKLILETGAPLVEAMRLYSSLGYNVAENYGQYKDMPESICMEKVL